MARFKITAEVPLLLTYFSFMMVSSIIMNLIMYKTCYNLMGYPEANCSRLGRYTDDETQELEKIVQPKATYVTAITEIIPNSTPILLSIIIGSWSDKYGRKPVIIYTLACITVAFILSSIMLIFEDIGPYWLILGAVPVMACGGAMTFFTVNLAYLNDIATPENRGLRNAIYEGIVIFSVCFGNLISSPLLYATSYSVVYGLGAGLVGISAVYTFFFVPESLKNKSTEKASCSNVFTCHNLTEMLVVAGKKRPNNKKSVILILISISIIYHFLVNGETNVKTLFLRKVLAWTLTDRNIFTSWSSVVGIIGTIGLAFLLQRKLQFRETVISLMGICGTIGVSVLYMLATSNWFIYGTVPVGILGGLVNPMLRTKLAQTIGPGEMGKIFSLINVINSLSQMGSVFLYSFVYNQTLNDNPAAYNWLSIGFTVICIALNIVIIVIEARQPPEVKILPSEEKEHKTVIGESEKYKQNESFQ